MYRKRIDLRVRQDERDQWEEWATELGLGLSEMIRRAVPMYYLANKNPSRRDRRSTAIKVLSVPERSGSKS